MEISTRPAPPRRIRRRIAIALDIDRAVEQFDAILAVES